MTRPGRILVVEDLADWRDEIGNALRRDGFQVEAVPTSNEARQRLAEKLYHMMVLDIRMEESDQDNVEGMELLRELNEHGEAMKIMVLSGHGTVEQMREAFRDYKVADFLTKDDFDNQVFSQRVTQILTDEARVNLALPIYWEHGSATQVVLNLDIDGTRVKRDTPLQTLLAEELDDLLCRLFYKANNLQAKPLAQGHSGTGVLWVQPFYSAGAARTVVVKFGSVGKIDAEYRNFKDYVQPFVGGGRSTTVLDLRRTLHLGGIVYSLLGAESDRLQDFGSFYRHSDVTDIRVVLDRLFADTCGDWYANPGQLQLHDLTEDYQRLLGFRVERLDQALDESMKSVQGKHRLHFKSLGSKRDFTNPILKMTDHLRRPTYVCTTHGDFNEQNILIDDTGHAWLIDFLRTGRGHILRDVAQLDSIVRLGLLAPEDATLEERLNIEEALCSPERFSDVEQLPADYPTENQPLAKAYATALHLRKLARKLVAQNPRDDISEYYIALFYNSLNLIRFNLVPSVQREHALLCASLLADRVEP